MKTAIITSESSLNHNTGSGHPESIEGSHQYLKH